MGNVWFSRIDESRKAYNSACAALDLSQDDALIDLAQLSFKRIAYEAACLKMALKAETSEDHTTSQYIWRTQKDGHVRPRTRRERRQDILVG